VLRGKFKSVQYVILNTDNNLFSLFYILGCKMGQVSKVLVPHGSSVIVPETGKNREKTESCLDYKVCHCNSEGNLGHCQDIRCIPKDHCRIEHTMKSKIRKFNIQSNLC